MRHPEEMSTGWASGTNRNSMTHVFLTDGHGTKSLCGYRPRRSMRMRLDNGVKIGHIECLRCKERALAKKFGGDAAHVASMLNSMGALFEVAEEWAMEVLEEEKSSLPPPEGILGWHCSIGLDANNVRGEIRNGSVSGDRNVLHVAFLPSPTHLANKVEFKAFVRRALHSRNCAKKIGSEVKFYCEGRLGSGQPDLNPYPYREE
jgi:hypothetical protein